MINAIRCSMVCLVLLYLPLSAGAEEDPGAVEFSRAETLLWMTDQLKTIERPVKLTYQFDRTGTFESGFTDTVRFVVEAIKTDGMKTASLNFFTGERRFNVPPVENTNVNPVLKVYLQGDVYEMNRLTDTEGTSKERWRYFQRRIKFALADSAEIENVVVSFSGKEFAAYKVSFRPYINDSKRRLFEKFADKAYHIVVSDEIPGYLYRVETVVPADTPDAPPLIREVLQLVSADEIAGGAEGGL